MMTINVAAMRVPPADPPSGGGGASTGGGTDPAGFAALLRQTRAGPPAAPGSAAPREAPKPSANETAPKAEAMNESDAPREADAGTRARMQLRFKPRAPEATPPPRRDAPAETRPDEAPIAEGRDVGPETCEAAPLSAIAPGPALDPTVDAGMTQWLAGPSRAADGARNDADRGSSATTFPTDTDTSSIDERSTAAGRRPSQVTADTDLKEKAAQSRAQRADATVTGPFAGMLAEQRRGEAVAPWQAATTDRSREAAPLHAAAFAPTPAGDTALAAPTTVPPMLSIATPVDAPDFARELGLRLAILAKDGVHAAELHLNPAEMGPVSVQIVMEGTQARIDFGADLAVTRAAIEAGLPELASALADAGFTLAGGGVSQHAGGQRSGGREPGSPEPRRDRGRAIEEEEVQRVASAARRIVDRGGVDLFA